MEKISVIIPVYNGEKYLKECIESILLQTYKNLEIIIVDNKSTDNTALICDEYAKKDERIRVIHRIVHGWICDGRNDGLELATGEWITFVDADDWLDTDHYEIIMKSIKFPGIDIYCQGGCICEYPEKTVKKHTGLNEFFTDDIGKIKEITTHIFVPIYKFNSSPINMSAPWDKFYRKRFIDSNNIRFDTNVFFADDSFFNVQAFTKASIIAGTSQIGYHYRQNSASVTHNYRPDWPDKIYAYLEKLRKYLTESGNWTYLSGAFQFATLRCFLNLLRGCYLNEKNDNSRRERILGIIQWKHKPIYAAMINESASPCLSKKLRIVKQILKLRYIWPLEIIIKMERMR